VAAGSNCSGAASEASPVLEHMGMPGRVSFRVGIGRQTTEDEIDGLLAALPALVEELRQVEAVSEAAMARFHPGRTDPGDPR
jgi:cysteine desulfurase